MCTTRDYQERRENRETKEVPVLMVTSSVSRLNQEHPFHQSTTSGLKSSTPFLKPPSLETRENPAHRYFFSSAYSKF